MSEICNYRNCNNNLDKKRKGAKYCCVNCKTKEKIYLRRIKKRLEKWKAEEMRLVEVIKNMKQRVKKEYK